MEILQVIKTEEVDEKEAVSLQQPHISEETPYVELVKSERLAFIISTGLG
jgi:hypothetical protein